MAQAILLKDTETLGERGDVIDVSPGYLRNFLVPRKIAQPATPAAIAESQRRREAAERAVAEAAQKAEETAALLRKTVLTISHQAGDDGRLFGSVTSQEIVDAIRQARGVRLDKRRVALEEPIKTTGTHMVTVEVADGVTTEIKTIVTSGLVSDAAGHRLPASSGLGVLSTPSPLLPWQAGPSRPDYATALVAISVPPEAASNGVPPHNEEAEASVLGAILLTEQALDGVLLEVGLRAEDFYRPRHQLIFAAMIRLKEKAEPEAVDALTVAGGAAARRGSREGGRRAVRQLAADGRAGARRGARLRADRQGERLLRSILSTTRQIQDDVIAHRGDARELIERAESILFKIGHDGGMSEMKTIEAVLHDEIDKLEELSRSDVGLTGTPSGFQDIDDLTGGFQLGNLIVLAARPSMGKSTLATNIAENAAIEHGRSVALFSLEMSETSSRIASSRRRPRCRATSCARAASRRTAGRRSCGRREARRAPIYIDDSSDISVLEMRAKARRLHARSDNGLGLLIVDYLQLIRPDGRADSRVEQVGQISRGLKILARELEIPVIAVSQLSRAVESRNPPIPMLSDLRESGQVEQDSDVVMFVFRDEYYNRESERLGEADVIFAKHRNGPIGEVTLTFQPRYPRFSSMYRERGVEPPPARPGEEDAEAGRYLAARVPVRRVRRVDLDRRRGDQRGAPVPLSTSSSGGRGGADRTGIGRRFREVSFEREPIVSLDPSC